jgi:hypothetical protein
VHVNGAFVIRDSELDTEGFPWPACSADCFQIGVLRCRFPPLRDVLQNADQNILLPDILVFGVEKWPEPQAADPEWPLLLRTEIGWVGVNPLQLKNPRGVGQWIGRYLEIHALMAEVRCENLHNAIKS